ncbi:hypothetical protein [Streptomyces sp. YIM B13518]|uniref:hypothetical protein n=1 Tax=Streptomyces sp. YIM B13518 TaxID=3366316 RepID=UPI0036992095
MKRSFAEGAGPTCVLVDGLLGPQVTPEGIRLTGRVPSELAREVEAYAVEHDTGLRYSPGGDLFVDGFGIEPGARRAGDAVVTRAPSFRTGDIAGASRELVPAEVRRHWQGAFTTSGGPGRFRGARRGASGVVGTWSTRFNAGELRALDDGVRM